MTIQRRITRLLLAALVGGLAALLARWALSPARHVMSADFAALILDGCPAARLLYEEVTADLDVGGMLLLAPLNSYDHPLGRDVCNETLRVLRQRGVWSVAIMPERWACDWMAADLRASMSDVMDGSPTYLKHGKVLRINEVEAVMVANGLSYTPSRNSHGIRVAKRAGEETSP